ncbi:MAG: ribosome assembly RNA-binding protein YhbY [Chromatiales bacterium]|jgi:RNA-binding protein|nr:ribosome assembly RNA-binding protein YhbY [Chromatiales bacterium]MDX9766360.1 ribosome assembly RNA-binding protein YhbY [Ectothiorhodospiraceae bacterium]
MTLNERQRKHLRTLAHPRKPVVIIGRHGLTDNVLVEIHAALDHHELVKVRVGVGDRELRDEAIGRILDATGAELVQRIGFIATLFRRNPAKPVIELP